MKNLTGKKEYLGSIEFTVIDEIDDSSDLVLEVVDGSSSADLPSVLFRSKDQQADVVRQLSESQALYTASLDAIQEGYILHNRVGIVLTCNASAERILGTTAAELIGRDHSTRKFSFVDESGVLIKSSQLPKSLSLATGERHSAIMGVLLHGEVTQWLSMTSAPLFHVGDDVPYATVTTFYDITESRASEAKLRRSEERLQEAQHIAGIGCWEFGVESSEYWMSEEMYRIFGLDPNDSSAITLTQFFHPDDLKIRERAMWRAMHGRGPVDFDTRIVLPDGQLKWCHIRGNMTANHRGKVIKIAGTMMDITRRKLIEESLREHSDALAQQAMELEESNKQMDIANQRLRMLAVEDGMTGLKNHRAFQERLNDEVEEAKRYSTDLAAVMIDVDEFKEYNDHFGHPEGDCVLQMIAQILKSTCRECDSAARYGGEEFAMILPHTNTVGAIAIAERVRDSVATSDWPNRLVTVSIGVSSLSSMDDGPRDIVARADKALYHSKHLGRNRVTAG